MSDTRDKYDREHAQNAAFFKDAVEVWRGHGVVIMDARGCFEPMKAPWKRRPMGHVRGLIAHHKASLNSYEDMQNNVVMPRFKAHPASRHDRIAYPYAVDHRPPMIDGMIVIWQLNDLDSVSWHSGSPGKDSERFKRWRSKQGPGNSANQYTTGLSFNGFFASSGYPPNHPEQPTHHAVKKGMKGTLICHPSEEQCRALWGLWCYLVEECAVETIERLGAAPVFGHKDTGKYACPGTVGMELVNAIAWGHITNDRELDRWLSGRDAYIRPGGWPTPSDVYGGAQPGLAADIDYPLECQRMLVELGYDIGKTGPGRDGVDGNFGRKSRLALIEFEEEAGLLTNGMPEKADFDALTEAATAGGGHDNR